MILRRLEGSRCSVVARAWTGRTVVVIGCGPSLTLGDVEAVRRAHAAGMVHCVVVNDAFLWAPWADLHYAADAKWHEWMAAGVSKPRLGLTADDVRRLWRGFRGEKCSIEWFGRAVADPVHILRNRDSDVHGMGLSADPGMVATGRNSGAQAVNIAVLAGAARILLLGFDGQPGTDGQTHFHGGHATGTARGVWPYVKQSFAAIAKVLPAGVEIVNCTPGSGIDAFPRVPLGEALELAYA